MSYSMQLTLLTSAADQFVEIVDGDLKGTVEIRIRDENEDENQARRLYLKEDDIQELIQMLYTISAHAKGKR